MFDERKGGLYRTGERYKLVERIIKDHPDLLEQCKEGLESGASDMEATHRVVVDQTERVNALLGSLIPGRSDSVGE